MIVYTTYQDKYLSAIVRFWNRNFKGKRNFFSITEEVFRKRVVEKRNGIEAFDPAGLILAVDGDEVVGMLHAGVHSEIFCKTCYPDWQGGTQGYIAFICVDEQHRRMGIGDRLWQCGKNYVGMVSQLVIDGQCLNPFYGNSEYPFTPFWGTPEGPAVEWSDNETRRFFSKRGFEPRYKAIHLECSIDNVTLGSPPNIEGIEFVTLANMCPELGSSKSDAVQFSEGNFECVTAIEDDIVIGLLSYYPMREVGEGKFAIYEVQVLTEYRGKGIGWALLSTVLAKMKERNGKTCDVLTVPAINEGGLKLYERMGFTPCIEWAIY